MIIGITGRSGSGKSYISEQIQKHLNALHVKIDEISHSVLYAENNTKKLKAKFGESIFDGDQLDRKKLGKIVFTDDEKLAWLNRFCQTQMEQEIDSIIAANPNSIIILDYALLPWMKQFKKCDIKMLVSASFEDRFKRVQERENVTKEYFENRDKKIAGYNEFKFDLEVDNSKPLNINDILDFIKSKQEHNND